MARSETLFATNDLDGVHFKAPLPGKTAWLLLRNKPLIPSDFKEPQVEERTMGPTTIPARIMNQLRRFDRDGAVYLQMLKDARDVYGRDIKIAALTGRRSELHPLTKRRLERHYPETFDEYFLNDTDSASKYKELVARRLLGEGNSLVHIDDDLRAALGIARAAEEYPDQNVLVYLKRNLTNSPLLLRRSNVNVPSNIIIVSSAKDAGYDLLGRVRKGEL